MHAVSVHDCMQFGYGEKGNLLTKQSIVNDLINTGYLELRNTGYKEFSNFCSGAVRSMTGAY